LEEYLLFSVFGVFEINRANLDGSQETIITTNGTDGIIQLDFDIR